MHRADSCETGADFFLKELEELHVQLDLISFSSSMASMTDADKGMNSSK